MNHWYVAALTSEITEVPLGRTILGRPVVLYRLANGSAVALADRCPHRGYPLSLGTLVDSELVCGYHGFTFDGSGRCVAVPGQEHVPSRASVTAYPLIERGPWAWIFMGEPASATERPLPPAPWLDRAGWAVLAGMARIECRVELLIDNLLDLSHETYLHAGSIGTPEVAATPIETADRDDGVVRVWRHMDGVECPPFYSATTGLKSPVDRWQDIEYFPPALYVLHARIAPAGVAVSGEDGDAFHMKICYALTPSSEHVTYDFWALARDFALDDPDTDAFFDQMQRSVVDQDVAALNVLEARMTSDPDNSMVSVRADRGALAARRAYAAVCDNGAFTPEASRAAEPVAARRGD